MYEPSTQLNQSAVPIVTLLHLSWPAILEQLLLTAANYVDTAMVGSLGAGYSVQVAHALGGQDLFRARTAVHQAASGALLMGTGAAVCMLPLSWFIPLWLGGEPTILSNARAYLWFYAMGLPLQALLAVLSAVLRCSGDTRTPLLFNAGTNLLNICLNYLLIFPSRQVVILGCSLSIWGAGLGVTGAAIGTALLGGLMGNFYGAVYGAAERTVADDSGCVVPSPKVCGTVGTGDFCVFGAGLLQLRPADRNPHGCRFGEYCSGCRYAAHCCHFGIPVRPFYCSGRCASRGWGQSHAVSDRADGGVGSPSSPWPVLW